MTIEEISESKRKQIIKKSVDPLPNNPSKAGYKADEIKKAMFGFVTDEKDSIIAEINRIINEINFNFENIDLSDYDTKEEVRNLIKDFITNNTNELENYYTKKQVEASLATNADLSKKYTDERVAGLINSAPETLDTFKEIADALAEDQSVIDALNEAIGLKASKKDLSVTDEKVNRIESQLDDFVSTEELEKKDYATKSYVGENGGKIDSISVNGKPQQIDENKNVDITIPAYNDTKIKEDIEALQNDKVDKIEGKNLSSNDFTNEYKQKLEDLSNYDDTKIKEDIESLNTNKADKSEIPNVSEFITKGVNNLDNYYTKIQIDDKTEQAVNTAKNYTDTKVAELIDSAPETLDTFKEIADALKEDQDVLDTLNSAIGNKADKTALATTNAKVGALETDNATNKADIKELQENKADADDIPSNYVTTDTVQEVTGLKSFNDVQIKGTLMDNAGTRFNSLGMIQPKLTAGRGISIEGNTISSTAEDISVKDQNSVALKPYSGSGANVTENKDALTERAIATALPYINGSHKYTDAVDIYAPTSSGKTGQILVAKSSSNVFGGWEEKTSGGTPEWKDISELGLLTGETMEFVSGFDFPNSGNAFTIPLYKLATEKNLLNTYNYTIKFVSCGQIPDNTVINVRVGNSNQELDYNGCFMKFGTEIAAWDSGVKTTMAYQGVDTYEFIYNYARAGEIVGEFNISTANDGTDAIVLLQGNYGRAVQGASYVVNAVRFVKYYNLSSINTLYVSSANAFGGFKGRISVYRSVR